ncbi:unnamed protein product [Sphenostylis stenocarpa]|uniref:Uncharacterized protein n=1 Tax=Sphenostylis stenocarpa TaxID=92480 RepID=A0AA86VCZ3_9FABA|nr:unnamed protein product [Sphenostylis stenocarpa]
MIVSSLQKEEKKTNRKYQNCCHAGQGLSLACDSEAFLSKRLLRTSKMLIATIFHIRYWLRDISFKKGLQLQYQPQRQSFWSALYPKAIATSDMGALSVLLVLLIFCNSGFLSAAGGLFNFTGYGTPRKNVSRNGKAEMEEKRGVPSGANPLHNR